MPKCNSNAVGSCYVFRPEQLLRVSCILWCYYPKCYSIIFENASLWCFFVTTFSHFLWKFSNSVFIIQKIVFLLFSLIPYSYIQREKHPMLILFIPRLPKFVRLFIHNYIMFIKKCSKISFKHKTKIKICQKKSD